MRSGQFFKLVIAIGVSELAGIIGSVFTVPAIATWYVGLAKPALNPPNWVFGPVWTTLYALSGIAAWWVWTLDADREKKKRALAIFGLQLFLNAVWSIIFFGLRRTGLALVDIVLLWSAIVWTMVVFYGISKRAAWLLAPYLLWVSFASYLNYSIWVLN